MKILCEFTVLLILAALLSVSEAAKQKRGNRKDRHCGTSRCFAGQECIKRDGKHQCVCRLTCPLRHHAVCGTDGRTYYNPCELHRIACVEHRKIRLKHRRACIKDQSNDVPSDQALVKDMVEHLPLVCYQVQRDELRQLFVDWLKRQATANSKSYQDMAMKVFQSCDKDSNSRLDADELLKCTEKKESVKPKDTGAHVLRGLCVDALVNLGDHDGNWALDYREFLHLLHPQFIPKAKKCFLEDKKYSDGAKTVVECNTCVCACGDWVCTGAPCVHQSSDGGIPGPVKQGSLPSPKQREQLLNGFTASDVVLARAVQDEVAHIKGSENIINELNDLNSHDSQKQDKNPQ